MKRCLLTPTIWLHAIFTLLVCTNVNAQRFTHPGIPFTNYDLNQLKANITKEPWLSAYNAFAADDHSRLSYWTPGPWATVTRAPNLNNTRWISDMIAVRNLAFPNPSAGRFRVNFEGFRSGKAVMIVMDANGK